MLHDLAGHVLVEANGVGGATVREYIWMDDMPLAVVDNVNTGSPVLYHVHADHLDRPVMMTNSAKTAVWEAQYRPFGEVSAVTGTATLNLRFPGQWYQLEAGLAYNWHRHYDATIGRYLQPDPLGFVDGPSIFAYAKSSPQMLVDPDGRVVPILVGAAVGAALNMAADYVENSCGCSSASSGPTASALAGATVADAAIGIPYPRGSLGGSANQTSRLSSSLSSLGLNSPVPLPAPTLNNPLSMTRNVGRAVARWAPVAGVANAGYDLYRIGSCLSK